MLLSRTLLLTAVATTATVGLLLLSAPGVASASAAPGSNTSTVDRAHYGLEGAAPSTVSPSGCIQRADYPHWSSHVPATMNGLVTTTCRIYVPRISETAQMWESRWWGWDRIGTRTSVSVIDSKAKSTNASASCRNSTVRITGTGSVVDVDRRTYYASTESIHVSNPCHL